jgi:O-antigen/teichoic acid export membrane protein
VLSNKFLNDFRKRDGISVFISTFLVKSINAVLSILIVRILSKDDFGNISFALAVTSVLSVFGGFGANWSLLRFGSTFSNQIRKIHLFKYSLNKGSQVTLILITLIICFSLFIPENLINARIYLIILSFTLLTNFFYELIKSYFRIINRNKIYSKSNVYGSIIYFILSLVFAVLFGAVGYALALVFSPFVAFVIFYNKIYKNNYYLESESMFDKKQFWTYGVYIGLGTVANQLLLSLGTIIPGFLKASSADLAILKAATIIPLNLLIIPTIFLTTDFVHISKNHQEHNALRDYYLGYLKNIFLLSIIPFLTLFFFNENIILLLFGSQYLDSAKLMLVLNISIFFSFFLRVPLGNILAAVGKASWNVFNSIFGLVLFTLLVFVFYPIYGILSIAYIMSFIFILTGFVSLFMFIYYLRIYK